MWQHCATSSIESLCVPLGFLNVLGFSWIRYANSFPFPLRVRVHLCVCVYGTLHWTGVLSTVYSCLVSSVGIGSISAMTITMIMPLLKIDEYRIMQRINAANTAISWERLSYALWEDFSHLSHWSPPLWPKHYKINYLYLSITCNNILLY